MALFSNALTGLVASSEDCIVVSHGMFEIVYGAHAGSALSRPRECGFETGVSELALIVATADVLLRAKHRSQIGVSLKAWFCHRVLQPHGVTVVNPQPEMSRCSRRHGSRARHMCIQCDPDHESGASAKSQGQQIAFVRVRQADTGSLACVVVALVVLAVGGSRAASGSRLRNAGMRSDICAPVFVGDRLAARAVHGEEVKKNVVRFALGAMLSVAFLAVTLWRIDSSELGRAFALARPAWLAGAFGVYLLALWLRGARWRLVLRRTTRLSVLDATSLVLIGYAANSVLPLRAGEMARAQLVHERHGTDRALALGTIAIERVLDGLVLALFLAGALIVNGGTPTLRLLAAAACAVFIVLAVSLVVLGPPLRKNESWLLRMLAYTPARPRAAIRGLLDGLTMVRGPRAWSAILAVSAASWVVEMMVYWLVGVGMGLPLDPVLYVGTCAVGNFAGAAPWTSGGIGPFDLAVRETAVAFGAATVGATAYVIILHALLLIPVAAVGAALLWRRHLLAR